LIVILSIALVLMIVANEYFRGRSDTQRMVEPVEILYPRVTCAEGKAALDAAVQRGTAGEEMVLRPTNLVIHARAPGGDDHELECDGIRLPVVDAQQGDPTGPIRYPPGPHSVFVRPEPSGKFSVFTYCAQCNVVGQERGRGPL
jgi:hypothetical protein